MKFRGSFSFSLGCRVTERCAGVVRLDSTAEKDSLVAVSTSNKAIIKGEEAGLNIGDRVRSLSTIRLKEGYDAIVVGTDGNLMVYDAVQNITIFQKEVPDGVNCITVGELSNYGRLIFCGGNCAIWGFDMEGNDVFWTVTGDKVNALCLCDIDEDKENELIVGSEDFEIRIFKGDLMREEIIEVDKVTHLLGLGEELRSRFAYCLSNGSVGVYYKTSRVWRSKSKVNMANIFAFPTAEFICCVWESGKIDIRSAESGDVLTRENIPGKVATGFASHIADEGANEIVVVFSDGKVKGLEMESPNDTSEDANQVMREFSQRKHNLLIELTNLEQEDHTTDPDVKIPANTEVISSLLPNLERRCVELKLETNTNVPIQSVAIFAEGIFQGESHVCIQDEDTERPELLVVPILPVRDHNVEMHVNVYVGNNESNTLHIFNMAHVLPRFSRYVPVTTDQKMLPSSATSYLEFKTNLRVIKMYDFMMENFSIPPDWSVEWARPESVALRQLFRQLQPLPDIKMLIVLADGMMRIETEDIECAGEIVHALAESEGIRSLSSHIVFPAEFAKLNNILEQMENLHTNRDSLATEISEKHALLKELIVRAEDAISIDYPELCRKYYTRLRNVERSVRQTALMATSNNERLITSLRQLHNIIQLASKCRVGEPARETVSACRDAVASSNLTVLPKIIEFGPV